MPVLPAGPPAPTLSGAWTVWRLDLLIVVVVVAAAGGYLAGMVAARRRGRAWPVRRAVAFFGLGLGGLAVIGLGWPAVYAPALFSVYALRLVLLLMVVPLLVALGRPVELAMTALSEGGAARLRRLLDSRPAKVFTVPVVSPLLLAVVPFVVFFTPWYPATLRYPVLGSVTDVVLLLWCIGEAIDVPFLVLLAVQWYRSDARQARQIDQLLDAAPAVAPSGAEAATVDPVGAETTRPWWEEDASIFGDRADQFRRRT